MRKVYLLILVLFSGFFGFTQTQDPFWIDVYDGQTVTAGVPTGTNGDIMDCDGTDYFSSSDLCGGFSQYCNNEAYTMTFCASTAGEVLKFMFYQFDTEAGFDQLIVHDGPSTASPVIATLDGTYTAATLPFAIRSSGSCLTFDWSSDGSTRGDGWQADIYCAAPPTACNANTLATDDCSSSPQICNIDGYCGTTNAWYTPDNVQIEDVAYGGNGVFCGSIENNSWVSFVADATSSSFEVAVSNCDVDGIGDDGIQVAILSNASGDCSTFSQMYCAALDGSTTGTAVTSTISANGLTVGEEYYIMIDGFGGNVCDYEITANTGVAIVDITSLSGTQICIGQSTDLTVNATGASGYLWDTGETTQTITVSPVVITEYCVTVSGVCGGQEVACITITPANPNVDFHAEDNTTFSTISPFPSTLGCSDDPIWLVADDSAAAGGYIVPGLRFQFTNDGWVELDGSYFEILDGSMTVIYNSEDPGNMDLQDNQVQTLTYYYLSPSESYTLRLCESFGDGGVDFEVFDLASGASLGSGTMVDGNPCETFGPYTPTGSATWSISPDPVGSYVLFDAGYMYFDPSFAAPGTYDFTYTWDDGNGCTGSNTRSITIGPGPSADVSAPATELTCTLTSITLSALGSTDADGNTSPPTNMDSYLWSTGATTSTIAVTSAGVYTVTTTDNGCEDVASITITANTTPPTADAGGPYGDLTCTTTQLVLDATTSTDALGVTDGSITYLWSASGGGNIVSGGATGTPTIDAAGTYTVTVTDQTNGCTDVDNVVINENITPPPADAGGPYGQITCNNTTETLTATGGGSYIWSASGGGNIVSGASTASPTVDAAGVYTVTVTSSVNGCTATDAVTITEPTGLSLTAGVNQNVQCNGGNDGSATATGAGGGGGYSYLWNPGGLSGATQNSLSAGVYTITVTDANTCTETTSVTITEPAVALSLSVVSTTNPSCAGLNDGEATVAASGGTTNYTYAWPGGQNTATVSTLTAAGSPYSVTVTDANSCEATTVVNLTDPAPLALTVTGTNVGCNNGSTGTANTIVSGGTPGYTYLWDNPTTSTTPSINNLPAGTYSVTVTDNSTSGCTITDSYIVTEPSAITLSMSGNNPSCNGAIDGDVTVVATGGTTSYTYQWGGNAGFQTNATATGLGNGTYNVTVTDNNGCSETDSQVLTEPAAMTLTMGSADANCGAADGSASVTVTGGTGPYNYNWSNGGNTPTINTLSAGTYTVTVTDNASCTSVNSVGVNNAAAPTITVTAITSVTCNGESTGSVTAEVSGGNPNYDWVWSNGVTTTGVTTHTITGLIAGNYFLTITDQTPCVATSNGLVAQPTLLTASIIATNNPDCNGGTDGTATISASGGTTNYTYAWSNGGGSPTATGLGAGAVSVTVTDANGCQASDNDVLTQPNPLVPTTTITDASCNGNADGGVNLEVTGGTSGYTYNWSTGVTSQDLTNVIAASYDVTITDTQGCITTTNAVVDEPNVLSLSMVTCQDVSTAGGSDGISTANVTGGTTNYTFNWNTGANATAVTTHSITGLTAGSYTVTVTDGNGCESTANCVVSDVSCTTTGSTTVTAVLCNGDNNGVVEAALLGSAGSSITYQWDALAGSQTTATATGLSTGNYSVTMTDNLNCVEIETVNVPEPTTITGVIAITPIDCNGAANGEIDLTVSGGVSGFVYNWNVAQTTQDISGLSPGLHIVTVTDANGCSEAFSGNVTQPALLSINTTVSDVSCFGMSNGSVLTNVTGGTTAYNYNWSNGSIVGNIAGLSDGSYSLTVTDNNGCVATTTVTVTAPSAALSINVTTTDPLCNGASNGLILLAATGGTTNYSYDWSNGATTQNITGLNDGSFNVTVTDANGCTASQNNSLNDPASLTASVSCTDVSITGGSDGQSEVSATGGNTPYNYIWNDGATTALVTGLSQGGRGVTITDDNGCVASASCAISDPSCALSVSTTVTSVNCFGAATGEISATPAGGLTPYTFNWTGGITGNPVTGLSANTYDLTITDGAGCTLIENNIVVGQPSNALSLTITDCTDPSVLGGSDGSTSVAASGGTTGYSFNWSNGATTNAISGLPAGNYVVTVSDANSCISIDNCSISDPGCSIVISTSMTSSSCDGASDGTATAIPSGGLTPYSYLWPNAGNQTTQTATGLLGNNTYNVQVFDNAGCAAATAVSVSAPGAITVSTSSVDALCVGDGNGSVSASVSGGNTNFTYSWTGGYTGSSVTGLFAGIYDVTVSDNNGCVGFGSETVGEPVAAITVDFNPINSENCGGADGSVTANGVGGNSVYTYLWNTGDNTPTINGLIAGTYFITVTDGNGCNVQSSVDVPSSSGLAITLTSVSVTCNGGSDGAVTAVGSGGTSPYTFLWSEGTTTNGVTSTITGVNAQTINLLVIDANNCPFVDGIPVAEPDEIAISLSSNDPGCAGNTDGEVIASVTGGRSGYVYQWFNGETDDRISGIAAGVYDPIITVTDINGCFNTASTTVSDPTPLNVVIDENGETCLGDSDGSAEAFGFGGTQPYTYLWSNGETTKVINNLAPGNYEVTISDNNSCTAVNDGDVISGITMNIALTTTPATCFGGTEGTFEIKAAGGTAPYSYLWPDGSTVNSATGLAGGIRIPITVSDASGCSHVENITIGQPDQLQVTLVENDANCGVPDGSLVANTVGGNGTSYSYNWFDNYPPSGPVTNVGISYTGLDVGIYSVIVYDDSLCSDTAIGLIQNIKPEVSLSINQHVLCNGANDGSLTGTAVAGTSPYTFSWVPATTTVSATGLDFQTVTGLSAGTYFVSMVDDNGCVALQYADIIEPTIIDVGFSVIQPVLCNNNSDAILKVDVTGGTGSGTYSFQWDNGETSQVVSGLSAGTYSVTVSDSNGCSGQASTTLTNPPALSLTSSTQSVDCSGGSNGAVTVTVVGGTSPFTYNWNDVNNSTTNPLTGLQMGSYTVTVLDANGCVVIDNVSISESPSLNVAYTFVDEVCDGSDGVISFAISGGATAYNYNWSNNASGTGASASISGLTQGVYTITVVDGNNCEFTESVTMTGTSIPNTPIAGPNQEVCFGDAITSIFAVPPTTQVTWYDDASLTSSIGSGISFNPYTSVGNHVYYVTDTKDGCESAPAIVTVTIKPLPQDINLVGDTVVCRQDSISFFISNQGGEVYWFADANANDTINIGESYVEQISTYDTVQTYYFQVVVDGCVTNIEGVDVTVGDSTVASFVATPEEGTVDLEVQFTNTSNWVDEDFDYFYWDFGTGDFSSEFEPNYLYTEAGEFVVSLIVEDYITGCTDTASVVTIVTDATSTFEVPSVFSPNGDNHNEIFKVDGNNLTNVKAEIYNRWGELIWQWDQPEGFWDGRTSAGGEAPEGTYFYIITAEGLDENGNTTDFDTPISGSVTLIR